MEYTKRARGKVEAGAIDPAAPIYDIARTFNLSPARVRTLIFNWQLRSTAEGFDLRAALVDALRHTRFAKDGAFLTFGIESPLLREEIIARLKMKGVFADATFAREIVRLPVDAFVEFLDGVVDDATKRQLRKILLEDKQLPDRSFKALATGILAKLGEKVAGKAGEAVAGALVEGASEVVIKPAAERMGSFLSRPSGRRCGGRRLAGRSRRHSRSMTFASGCRMALSGTRFF